MAGRPINDEGYRNYVCSCGDYLDTGATGAPNNPGEPHNVGKVGEKCDKCGEYGFEGPSGYTIGGVV